jgi:hypothetical protein
MELIVENWQTIVGVVGLVGAVFFPKLKPVFDAIIKDAPAPKPKPITIDNPKPNGSSEINRAFEAAVYLIAYFEQIGNDEGQEAARQAGQFLFAVTNEGDE